MVKTGVLNPPSNDTTAPLTVLVSTILVSTLTAPIKRAPPECVTVRDDNVVVEPIAPFTWMVPTVPALMVSACAFAVVPAIVPVPANKMPRPALNPVVVSNMMLVPSVVAPVYV